MLSILSIFSRSLCGPMPLGGWSSGLTEIPDEAKDGQLRHAMDAGYGAL